MFSEQDYYLIDLNSYPILDKNYYIFRRSPAAGGGLRRAKDPLGAVPDQATHRSPHDSYHG